MAGAVLALLVLVVLPLAFVTLAHFRLGRGSSGVPPRGAGLESAQ